MNHSASVLARDRPLHIALLAAVSAVFIWSTIAPADRPTWWLESFPVMIALPILLATRRRFPLTRLAYILIAIHAIILLVGGHYTYAMVPLGDWVRDLFHMQRNDYDRLGHVAQGFVPAIIARELLLRHRVVSTNAWRAFLVVCICLAISATYELIEWTAAAIGGGAADQFLGTQGDPFDTQKDMCCALFGAIAALVLLSKVHDRELEEIGNLLSKTH